MGDFDGFVAFCVGYLVCSCCQTLSRLYVIVNVLSLDFCRVHFFSAHCEKETLLIIS